MNINDLMIEIEKLKSEAYEFMNETNDKTVNLVAFNLYSKLDDILKYAEYMSIKNSPDTKK